VRLLHLGWGFSPWLGGGLVAYAEGLMEGQAARGHHVAYFAAGRHHPHRRRPAVKRWERRGVNVHELVNSPIPQHWSRGTLYPERHLSEPWTEARFTEALEQDRPDIVHIQHLAGLPSSLLGIAHDRDVPVVMTLEDYEPLCPVFKLFDADGQICLRLQPGHECVRCSARAPADASHLVEQTLRYELVRLKEGVPLAREMSFGRAGHAVGTAAARLRPQRRADPSELATTDQPGADAYQRRRDVNVARLSRVDRLIAQSPRLEEIYRALGVQAPIRTMRLTLPHLERLRPRRLVQPPRPVTFATLNGCSSEAKGAHSVAKALRLARAAGAGPDELRLTVLGDVDADVAGILAAEPGVELVGRYRSEELDHLLTAVDVGLVPSLWEEALGYVGLEFLAKGIPVIGNARGGIVDYTRPGRTGWLNRSASAEELADHMLAAARNPDEVLRLHREIVEAREELIVPMARHLDEVDAVYAELLDRS
jgi:glycosyltransferase involved in cell wall biosynthesis